MRYSVVPTLAAFAALASAQTPEGFKPKVEENLAVIFGDELVSPPGKAFTKEATAALPVIGTAEPLEGSYLLMVIDISVPASFTPGNYEPRRTLLHAMISNYTSAAEPSDDDIYVLSADDDTSPASYMGPSPPAEDPPKAHTYIQLLFEQPADWETDVDFAGFNNRMGFDAGAFAEESGLGEAVAANYFSVTGVA